MQLNPANLPAASGSMPGGIPGLDFVVCGVPRGGTTFFAQLFNVHEDAYCYFMETSLFRQLHTFGRDRPFPAANLDVLERWLSAEFSAGLVEATEDARVRTFRRLVRYRELLASHGLTEPSGPGIRVWDKQSLEPFLQDILDLFRRGLHGRELFEQGLQLLRQNLARVSARPIMGEKTPDNVFFLDDLHGADPELTAFCTVREPYSTLESMKRRAHRSETFFDSAFSKEFLGGLAQYATWIAAAYDYTLRAPPGRFHVYRFEDLVRDPASVMERAYAALGLAMTPAAGRILPQMSLPTDQRHTRDLELTATEHRLIQVLLGPMLEHFGYDVDLGKDPASPGIEFSEGVLPLSGIHLDGELSNRIEHKWMARRADMLLLFGNARRSVRLGLDCRLPAALGAQDTEVTISIGGRNLATHRLPASSDCEIEIPLDDTDSMMASRSMRAAQLRITSSAAYTPITVEGCGPDVREFSLIIRSCSFA